MIRTIRSAGLCLLLVSAFSATSSASDPGVAASFYDDIAQGFCAPEFLENTKTGLTRCRSALKSPVDLCAKETGIYDYIASDDLSEQEWQTQFEAVSETFTSCLFSKLQTASENAENPNRDTHTALLSYYSASHEFEETESEFFTGEEIASGTADDYLAEQAIAMNADLPKMVDDLSRLEQVTYADRIFRQYYTIVGVTEDEFQNEFNPDEVRKFFVSNACSHYPSRNAMKDGVKFAYEFRTEDGSKHTDVSVSSTDCEGLE